MNTSNSFVLFYSNHCQYCKEFLLKLKHTDLNLFNQFTKVCVDNSQIPDGIEVVPTIIVPTHSYPLTDQNIFNWLDSIKGSQVQSRQLSNETELAKQQPQLENLSSSQDGISPYIQSEMGGGFSDGFSFLDDSQSLKHNFTFLEGSQNNLGGISDTPIGNIDRPSLNQTNKSTSSFDSEYEKYMSNRDNDPTILSAISRK